MLYSAAVTARITVQTFVGFSAILSVVVRAQL